MASHPATPFSDGIFSTVIKCAWCHRRCDFFFDQPGGGARHKFQDWISGRVVNRWQIICDTCHVRGVPPHYGRLKHTGFPPVIWDLIVLFTYEECAEANICLERHKMAPGYGPSSLTFQESPLNYIHDTRMWQGVICQAWTCNTTSPITGLCIHTEDLRRRLYRRQMQRDVNSSV